LGNAVSNRVHAINDRRSKYDLIMEHQQLEGGGDGMQAESYIEL